MTKVNLHNQNIEVLSILGEKRVNEYSQFESMPLLRNYECPFPGRKFIIQRDTLGNSRLRFDPMELVGHFHEELAELFDDSNWEAKNGGWFIIVDNKVILFHQSRDLGVYKNEEGIAAAKKLFPNKEVCSHAMCTWSEIKHFYIK